jgi:hypothetical protein
MTVMSTVMSQNDEYTHEDMRRIPEQTHKDNWSFSSGGEMVFLLFGIANKGSNMDGTLVRAVPWGQAFSSNH